MEVHYMGSLALPLIAFHLGYLACLFVSQRTGALRQFCP